MKKTRLPCDCDAGESSTQESDNVNTKLRQRKKVARDENDDFLVLRNEMKEWLALSTLPSLTNPGSTE
ncbi:unnamed protein product [Leptosia nina]|uniref:Uncharacterized protein n=1 Tax=Leptosia nina TaxID=320188 RepID=A0AAV1JCF0_9NEOP